MRRTRSNLPENEDAVGVPAFGRGGGWRRAAGPPRSGAGEPDRRALDLLGGDLLELEVQHRLVVGGGVGTGVAGSEHRTQRLARLIGVGRQRVESVAVLI